ncbi:hypothetical protein AVEN_236697-1 [Araneus ventricosus]|uniref:Uncharacterized protein n=1 Tax=Araneus ventricosus TaxID=182803 RepID=A0A4Y2U9D1_ARAVE|nr:hypothetical protein AVEN_236697-1 [Araneus ventricosus]
MVIDTKKITVKEKTPVREIDSKIRIMIILLTKDIDHVVSSAEKANAVLTRSQVKRSSEENRNKEAEMEKPEEMSHIEIDEDIFPQADEEYKETRKSPVMV